MERLKLDVHKKHELDKEVKTVQLRKCWWVYFDVNGNAPSDADAVACATEELANEVLSLFGAMRDQKREPGLVLKGELFYGLMRHSVDGWNFDTYYSVRMGWAEDSQIITSLAGLANPDIFDRERTIQAEDGLYLGDENQDLDSLDNDPVE